MLTSTKVRDFLDLMLADSKDSTWSRPLLFPCAVVAPGESCSGPLVFTEDNICKYTESLYKGFKLYFDFEKYKVSGTTTIDAKDPAWKLEGVMRRSHEIGAQHCGDGHCFQWERWSGVSETNLPPWHFL
jgi:hypothetical protein